jgi:hypothetical protein
MHAPGNKSRDVFRTHTHRERHIRPIPTVCLTLGRCVGGAHGRGEQADTLQQQPATRHRVALALPASLPGELVVVLRRESPAVGVGVGAIVRSAGWGRGAGLGSVPLLLQTMNIGEPMGVRQLEREREALSDPAFTNERRLQQSKSKPTHKQRRRRGEGAE